MSALILVACSGPKLEHAAPARDLYTSMLFRKARAYAESRGEWLILSALHGVVEPDRVLEPYDRRMPTTRAGRSAWARMVRGQMHKHRDRQIICLAGSDYCGWISELVRIDEKGAVYNSFNVERPLEGMGIGKQLRYLTNSAGTTCSGKGFVFARFADEVQS